MTTSKILLAGGKVARSSAWGPPEKPRSVPAEAPPGDAPEAEAENDLAAASRLIRSNDRLLAEMRSLGRRIAEAKSYLSQPGCRARLGAAYLDRLEDRRSVVRACLRANRIEARGLLESWNS